MTSMTRKLTLLSRALTLRGALMVLLGLAAVVWTEAFLIPALLAVGVTAAALGLYEVAIAYAIRPRDRRWLLVLAHGSASIAFGLLTVEAAAIPLRTALFVTAAWLVAYAGAAGIGAHMAMPVSMARRAATAWALLDVALALLVLAYPATTIFSLLFFGAVYAAMFGAWQLAVGRWLRSGVRHGFARPRNPHANSSPARLHGSSLRQ